ncbi:transposase [Paracoccus sp. SSJ]|uniref:IS66-like element accessory protein TnpA n=1 Tax=Paracoccus sp. SSJ TaxID=3050636 RepID=UPI00254FF9C1|nr:transposase [Paracoccus sp. SSJ]MDK8875556.1 transposase [Paracoccus sp. SSJ]
MRGDILGLERRRRWSDEEKLGIVLSVGMEGATVTQVAHRHEVTRQQLYAWRHELKKKGLLSPLPETLLLPVELTAPAELTVHPSAGDPAPQRPALIELQLSNGRCLRFDPMLDTAELTRLIRVVEAA